MKATDWGSRQDVGAGAQQAWLCICPEELCDCFIALSRNVLIYKIMVIISICHRISRWLNQRTHKSVRITLFCSVSFPYNDEKKNWFQLGPLSLWNVHSLPMFTRVFFVDSGFLPYPRDVHMRWNGMSTLSPTEWLWVCVSGSVMEGCPIQDGFSRGTLSGQDRLRPHRCGPTTPPSVSQSSSETWFRWK